MGLSELHKRRPLLSPHFSPCHSDPIRGPWCFLGGGRPRLFLSNSSRFLLGSGELKLRAASVLKELTLQWGCCLSVRWP